MISSLVGLKNNLEYSKNFYKRFREIYPTHELIFVSYGSNDGTNEWLESLLDNNVKYYYEICEKTLSDSYNKAAELATNEYITFLHNDIVVCKGFLENIFKHCSTKIAVGYTTIEPPIFNTIERSGKIIRDFGQDFSNVNVEKLENYVEKTIEKYFNKISEGIFFFMALSKKEFLNIGGFDNLFSPMFCEDDDLIKRLSLNGFNFITSLDSIVYHFVSKTSRFSEEFSNKTKLIEENSNKNYLRKWGSRNSNNRFDIGVVVNNCTTKIIEEIEPYFSTLYIDNDIEEYISLEQSFTKINLKNKFLPIDSFKNNDYIITFDDIEKVNINILKNISYVLSNIKAIGKYSYENVNIEVRQLNTYEYSLIDNNSKFYNNLLL